MIADLEPHALLVAFDRDRDRLTGAVLDRVREEVRDQLVDAMSIPGSARRAPLLDGHRAIRRRQMAAKARQDLVGEREDIDVLLEQVDVPRTQRGEIEILDDDREVLELVLGAPLKLLEVT